MVKYKGRNVVLKSKTSSNSNNCTGCVFDRDFCTYDKYNERMLAKNKCWTIGSVYIYSLKYILSKL